MAEGPAGDITQPALDWLAYQSNPPPMTLKQLRAVCKRASASMTPTDMRAFRAKAVIRVDLNKDTQNDLAWDDYVTARRYMT